MKATSKRGEKWEGVMTWAKGQQKLEMAGVESKEWIF